MKKLLIALVLFALLPAAAFASSVSLSPASISLTPGETFTVSIVVSPSESDYTVKAALSYPSNLVQVVSFIQASGWLPLSQPGYDAVDNASGSLVKTAGYSGGFSAPKAFGTVTFRAVAAGTARISAGPGTQILDADNQNTFSSGGSLTATIAQAPVLPVVPPKKTVPSTGASNPSRAPLSTKPAVSVIATTSEETASSSSSTPAVAAAETAVAGARNEEVTLTLGVLSVIAAFASGLALGKRQKRGN